ncbi:MAG TPA: trypsin-like peptidase domain-containing protein [candidate division Zixibacteria bacterium]|nr:trypsin-like peptidase domain-containing protein [candidate division Zixibacteria bacterium]
MPFGRLIRALGLAAVLAVALAACTDVDASPSPTSLPPSPTPFTSPAPEARGTPLLGSVADIVDRVQPSVVSIAREGAEGSGVIWSADGLVVTNEHVVRGASRVEVVFADGQRSPAEVLATDPRTDLAVIRTERTGLPPATFAEELPRVGDLALAMGNPIGFENSVTAGIISGLHRSIPGAARQAPALVDLIQTDAAISPGNSGGALVDAEGRVVGINVAYLPPTGGAVSIGFAIPAATVRDVVEQLLEDGTAEHAYLGIQPATVTQRMAQQFDLGVERGVVVLAVGAGTPAETAGIRPGDVITALDGQPLETAEELLAVLRGYAPGDEVTLTVVRRGDEMEITVRLGQLPTG